MRGRIIKGIAGFYYVDAEDGQLYECKARGIFRKEKMKPLVGDLVEIEILDQAERTGNLIRIQERRNQLIRPAVSNVDQALVIFAATSPEPNLNLLDRFLITMEERGIPAVICFNKCDLVTPDQVRMLRGIYEPAGYELHFISVKHQSGIDEIGELLKGKVTTVAGPSGVGKSSLMNILQEHTHMEVGSISDKIERGKHTTRHAQLIQLEPGSYLVDTPGFSSLSVEHLTPESVRAFFPEIDRMEGQCRFHGCVHIHEPSCGVKSAVEQGDISRQRYENYLQIYEECKNKRRY
ncbi:MAG: ribosome small subunit-dependent GTPase A [Lachnospiraceae bacterium]|nr:ribosome small subunit-dependent GTPase A [Lachnospiraceae bacterium]